MTIPDSNVSVLGGDLVDEGMIVDLICKWNPPHKTLIVPQIRLIGNRKTFNFDLDSFGSRALSGEKVDFSELFQFLHIGSERVPAPKGNAGMALVEFTLSRTAQVGFRIQREGKFTGARMVVTCALSTRNRKLVLESDQVVDPRLKDFFRLR